MISYFGPAKFKKAHEQQIATPIGRKCDYCDEPVVEGDIGTLSFGQVRHHECELRMIAGSLCHQQRLCSCFGGTTEDPEGMTKREAAIAAARYFYKHDY